MMKQLLRWLEDRGEIADGQCMAAVLAAVF